MPVSVLVQAALALFGLALVATWPPASGPILLVPVTAEGARRLAPAALETGARLLAPGPVRGSLVVDGERARLRAVPGTLLLSARSAGCGSEA